MEADINHSQHEEGKPAEHINRDRLIRQVSVEPEVPLFITYFTLYPDQYGQLQEYRDVYGYDKAIIKHLTPYI